MTNRIKKYSIRKEMGSTPKASQSTPKAKKTQSFDHMKSYYNISNALNVEASQSQLTRAHHDRMEDPNFNKDIVLNDSTSVITAIYNGNYINNLSDFVKIHPNIEILEDANDCKVMRLWVDNSQKPKILILKIDNNFSNEQKINLIENQFGNVDIGFIGRNIEGQVKIKAMNALDVYYESKSLAKINQYLDHGQQLNLSEFITRINPPEEAPGRVFDLYKNNFHNLQRLSNEAPNGALITQTLPTIMNVVHQTPAKDKILDGKTINVSRAGCLGNAIYGTMLQGENSDIIGGHTQALDHRLQDRKIKSGELESHVAPDSDEFILFEITEKGNQLTNWIDRFGFGRLFNEARLNQAEQNTSTNELQNISEYALAEYTAIYPFLTFLQGLALKEIDTTNMTNEELTTLTQDILTKLQSSREKSPIFLNNIVFEIIKEYILLFLNDETSEKLRTEEKSFNLQRQYDIIFELAPEMQQNWNTRYFSANLPRILAVLNRHEFELNEQHPQNLRAFNEFLINSFLFYINMRCLEGCPVLPAPTDLSSLDDLAKYSPNIAGILHHFIGAELYLNEPTFQNYLGILRDIYDKSFEERNLKVLIKAGLYRTDEIGLRENVSAVARDLDITRRDNLLVANPKQPVELQISRNASQFNGLTVRTQTTQTSTIPLSTCSHFLSSKKTSAERTLTPSSPDDKPQNDEAGSKDKESSFTPT